MIGAGPSIEIGKAGTGEPRIGGADAVDEGGRVEFALGVQG